MTNRMSSRAMLASLNISTWEGRKSDKKATAKVATDFKAESARVGNYRKSLVDREAFKKIQSVVSAARTFHASNTLPWSDDGLQILPVENYQTWAGKMVGFKDQFNSAVAEFLVEYDSLREKAKTMLGDLYDDKDYPPRHSLERRFAFDNKVLPLPDAGDFRVELAEGEREVLAEQIENRVREEIEAAQQHNFRRLKDAVSHMAERLAAYQRTPDGKATGIFRDSLVTNVCELIELLPRLNLTKDPELDAIVLEARATLCRNRPDDLREDDHLRQETARKASELANKIGSLAGL